MTNRQAKKEMTRQQRKDYKATQREGRQSFYVFVTRETPKNSKDLVKYTKLVSREKASKMIYGKWNPLTQTLDKPKHIHIYKIQEVK